MLNITDDNREQVFAESLAASPTQTVRSLRSYYKSMASKWGHCQSGQEYVRYHQMIVDELTRRDTVQK